MEKVNIWHYFLSQFGVVLDFGVRSLTDFVVHLKVDVPVPGLAFKELHVENKVTIKNNKKHFLRIKV